MDTMKIFLASLALALSATPFALAAPSPTVAPSKLAQRQKAVIFLDGIAAAHRKLRSLSGTWKRSVYDPASGSIAWLNARPSQVHYEENGALTQIVAVSNGVREHTIVKSSFGGTIDTVFTPPAAYRAATSEIGCDEVTQVVLSGRNPLRTARWGTFDGQSESGEARLLPAGLVRGIRCRGVEWKEVIEGRDNSVTETFSMWFDARGIVRRTAQSGFGAVVDFELRSNLKLAPALFQIPNRPDGETVGEKPEMSETNASK